MVTNTKNDDNEKYKLQDLKYREKTAKHENEKCTLYGEKSEINEKL